MGFGHYTAFARNPINGKWYEFDDSRVQELKYDSQGNLQHQVCTNAAYNLFYRRRNWHEKNRQEGIDFEKIAIKPDMQLL